MLRSSLIFVLFFSSLALAQNVVVTSAASATAGLAPESLATISGSNLSLTTAQGKTQPWPTTLAGVTVQVADAAAVTRTAGLLLVSPTQINFQVPAGTAPGPATMTIVGEFLRLSAPVTITRSAPALFSVNQQGVAAATAIRVVIPTQIQSPVPVFHCTGTLCQLDTISLGVDTPIYLTLYGTGIRGRSSLSNVKVTIGTVDIDPTYAGPQPQTAGLDQVNVPLTLELRRAGEVSVTVTVDGVRSNAVKIDVQ